jgi:hypothetical protein
MALQCCGSDRLWRPCSPKPRTGRNGVRVPGDRRPARGADAPGTGTERRPPGEGPSDGRDHGPRSRCDDPLREFNQRLHDVGDDPEPRRWRILNLNGACGRVPDAALEVEVAGHVGYYCAGMNQRATVRVRGNVGTGLAENMMSGIVVVDGNASQSAGAAACSSCTAMELGAASR